MKAITGLIFMIGLLIAFIVAVQIQPGQLPSALLMMAAFAWPYPFIIRQSGTNSAGRKWAKGLVIVGIIAGILTFIFSSEWLK